MESVHLATDIGIFNSRMDDIARGILGAFGINASVYEAKPVEMDKADKLYRVQVGRLRSR